MKPDKPILLSVGGVAVLALLLFFMTGLADWLGQPAETKPAAPQKHLPALSQIDYPGKRVWVTEKPHDLSKSSENGRFRPHKQHVWGTSLETGTNDLKVDITPQHEIAIKGERLSWKITVTTAEATPARLSITIPREAIDVRLSNGGDWRCDYTSRVKMVVCDIASHPAESSTDLFLSVRLPSQTAASHIKLTAQVEGNMPDANLQNNRQESVLWVGDYFWSTPPSGFLFTHIRHSHIDQENILAADYLSDDLITAVLQSPFDLAFAYHQKHPPMICLTAETPCPIEDKLHGQVYISAFTIHRIIFLDEAEQILFAGIHRQEINRTAAAVPANCVHGRCVGYGMSHADRFRWHNADMISIYPFTKGERTPECHRPCIILTDTEPGYYRIEGEVELLLIYENRPEFTQTIQLSSQATFQLIAPFIEPSR